MSKVDAQRAMREAKYERLRASGPTRREAAAQAAPEPTALVEEVAAPKAPAPRAKKPRPARTAAPAPAAEADALLPAEAPTASGLCGHKSMNGRACTREAGHAEKSHRYG